MLRILELSSSSPKWKKIIEEEYHLSYPYIFETKEGIFIMPESGANSDLTVYRAVSFPDKWEKSLYYEGGFNMEILHRLSGIIINMHWRMMLKQQNIS